MSERPARIDHLRIQAPCPMRWEGLRGSDRERFCDQCQLSVYNSAALTRNETEELLRRRDAGARLCMRIERRGDGSLVSADGVSDVSADGATRRGTLLARAASFGVILAGGLLAACRRVAPPPAPTNETPPVPPTTTPGQHDPVELGEIELGDVVLGAVAPDPRPQTPSAGPDAPR